MPSLLKRLPALSLLAASVLSLCAWTAPPGTAAPAFDFPDPTGAWSGSYLIPWPDGSPRWWGDLDLTVDQKGLISGTGDLSNSNGGYWTLVVQAGVVGPDGAVRIVFHDSVGDTAVLLSFASDIQDDVWTIDFDLVATYDVLPGTLVMTRS